MVPGVLLIVKNRAREKTSFEEDHVQSSRARSLNFAAYIWCGWLFLPGVIKARPRARLPRPAHPCSRWDLVDGGGGEDLPALCPGRSECQQLGCLRGLRPGRIPIIILRTSTPSCEWGKLCPVVGSNLIQPELLYSGLDCFSHDICYFSVHGGCFLCSLPCPRLRSGAQLKARFAPASPLSWGWGVSMNQEQMLSVFRVGFCSSKLLFSQP